MSPAMLFKNIIRVGAVDENRLQSVLESLPNNASVETFRKAIIDKKLMTLSEVMHVHFESVLLPESKKLLRKIKDQRANKTHHKPSVHKQKFLITEDNSFNNQITLVDGELVVKVPDLDSNNFQFDHSDEKQAIMLAIDLAKMGEVMESETILLETLDSFNNSLPAMHCLCWLYLCTQQENEVEGWSKQYTQHAKSIDQVWEISALAYQLRNKHLLATAQYQKLVQINPAKSLWYLLLAYSQEKSLCFEEARENFQIYSSIGTNEELKELAQSHLGKLTTE